MFDLALALLMICVVSALLWIYFTAQRLHRLHIRLDAALQSLQAALDRRVADKSADDSATGSLVAHELSSHYAELVDADVRVELAHRFYNEAVASTRGLRVRPLVKYFRLGGRAPLPDFFQYTSYLSS